MIKIQFVTDECDDVCAIIEDSISNDMEIEDWIVKNIEGGSFYCMDFPYDMGYCYDCYLQSNTDNIKAKEVDNLLKTSFLNVPQVKFSVWVTDEMIEEIYKIT